MAEPGIKIALAADLERARGRLSRAGEELGRDLDVQTHLKHSFREHKAAYIGGATFLGLILAKLPARKKKVYVAQKAEGVVKEAEKAGLWLVVLQMLFKMARPTLTAFASKQASEFLKNRFRAEK
jgi:hypothetical protein